MRNKLPSFSDGGRRCLFILLSMFGLAGASLAQCPNNNNLTATISPPCPGTTTISCVQAGQYALVNVIAGNNYTFSTCGSIFDTQITLYNNSGGALLGYNDDSNSCGLLSDQSFISWTATFTGQVQVLVDLFPCSSIGVCAGVTITCSTPPPPLTNDNPCGAIAVTVTSTCSFVSYGNVGATATAGAPVPSCSSYTGGDVWFTFVAPATGIAIIETAPGSLTDAAMVLYTASSCSGPFTEITCNDDGGPGLMPFMAFTNLNPGQTYYLRVFGYGGATGSFDLCIHGPLTIPAGNCVYILEMTDFFGDGWGTSSVTVYINGVPVGIYSVTGGYNAALIGLTIGQVITIQYNNSGIFQTDNAYRLSFLNTGQTIYNSGNPPAWNGSAPPEFQQTVDCNPPPSPPEDCIGAITICGNTGFNNNTFGTGNVQDLDASNYGCLAASEQQGTWYVWSPSTSGQIGFTIDPVGNDDYDFAVWGPYPPGSTPLTLCPPVGPPIRCSFSSGASTFAATSSYNTGMGSPTFSPPQWAPPAPAFSEGAAGDGWVSGIVGTAGQVYLLYISNFDLTGLAFTLNWTLQAGASLDCTVLPIELLTFEAQALRTSVELKWSTATEQMSDHFDVQRSFDGVQFTTIGQMAAAGTAMQRTNYVWLDRDPKRGVNFYRLRAVDQDGSIETSYIVSARFDPEGVFVSDPYPVPVEENVAIDISGVADGEVTIRILDPLGRYLAEQSFVAEETPSHHVTFSTAGWRPGLYAMEVRNQRGELLKLARWVKQ